MCGRYTLSSTPSRINSQFNINVAAELTPSYNIAPGTNVLIVHREASATKNSCDHGFWGLTPA